MLQQDLTLIPISAQSTLTANFVKILQATSIAGAAGDLVLWTSVILLVIDKLLDAIRRGQNVDHSCIKGRCLLRTKEDVRTLREALNVDTCLGQALSPFFHAGCTNALLASVLVWIHFWLEVELRHVWVDALLNLDLASMRLSTTLLIGLVPLWLSLGLPVLLCYLGLDLFKLLLRAQFLEDFRSRLCVLYHFRILFFKLCSWRLFRTCIKRQLRIEIHLSLGVVLLEQDSHLALWLLFWAYLLLVSKLDSAIDIVAHYGLCLTTTCDYFKLITGRGCSLSLLCCLYWPHRFSYLWLFTLRSGSFLSLVIWLCLIFWCASLVLYFHSCQLVDLLQILLPRIAIYFDFLVNYQFASVHDLRLKLVILIFLLSLYRVF